MHNPRLHSILLITVSLLLSCGKTQTETLSPQTTLIPVMAGWAKNSVNAVIFRKDPIATHGHTQYIAFYREDGALMIGKRTLGTADWEIRATQYTGNTKDAHNAICIAVDGAGILHMSWDHHGHPLRYCRSRVPGSLELTDKLPMTGIDEEKVTYPEFFNLPDGGLLFLYRDGSSGNGRTMLNRYDVQRREWSIVKHPLIDGMGERNAYTNQLAVDTNGGYHISWCWRETGDVASNHDICYAKSQDGGTTWLTSAGEACAIPITAENAEYIRRIPQNSELINHTSMTVDSHGNPCIATYWRPEGTAVPQYHLVFHDGSKWHTTQVGERTTPFSLSGGGTKRIPISRPKVLIDEQDRAFVIFRDVERGNGISLARCDDLSNPVWRIEDLFAEPVGLWEPSYDTALWEREKILHLFVQKVGQGDGETLEDIPPQMISVLECTFSPEYSRN